MIIDIPFGWQAIDNLAEQCAQHSKRSSAPLWIEEERKKARVREFIALSTQGSDERQRAYVLV